MEETKGVDPFFVFTDAFGRTDTWTMEGILNCVGPGWRKLLERLVNDLILLGWDGELHQVKEKFGGLRFYIGAAPEAVHDRIDQAEDESYLTCEGCGAPGKCWPEWNWLITHCAECNQKRHAERAAANKDFAEKRGGGRSVEEGKGVGGGALLGGGDSVAPSSKEVR